VFDIGFWEILVIAVVLLIVMGPERLPEVAKQAAFFVRKARQGMFRLRNEMRSELGSDPFGGLKDAQREVANFKNDIKQFGRDLADSHEIKDKPKAEALEESAAMSQSANALSKKPITKKSTIKKAKKKAKKKTASKKRTSKKKTKKVVAKD